MTLAVGNSQVPQVLDFIQHIVHTIGSGPSEGHLPANATASLPDEGKRRSSAGQNSGTTRTPQSPSPLAVSSSPSWKFGLGGIAPQKKGLSHHAYLSEIGFSGLPTAECGSFANVSKARKVKIAHLSSLLIEQMLK
jgi:hypothetical protein